MNANTRKKPNWVDATVTLVVLCLLAILIVPGIGDAQARAKTAKAQSDMGIIARALEAYRADHGDVPPGKTDLVRYDLKVLTTPVPYRKSLNLKDVFRPRGVRRDGKKVGNIHSEYLYFHLNGAWADRKQIGSDKRSNTYILESHGPDRIQDFVPQFAVGREGFGPEQVYDPTNGVLSPGDIARRGWDPPANPAAARVLPEALSKP